MKKQITISAALANSTEAGVAVPTRSMVLSLIPSADAVDMHAEACARLREDLLSGLAGCPAETPRKTKGRALAKAASRAARLHAAFEAAPDLDNRIRRDRHLSSKLPEFRWPGGGRRGVLQSLAKWKQSPTKETLVPSYLSESKAFNLREVYSLALQALSCNVTCAKMRECILEADPSARTPSSGFCHSKSYLCARVDGIAVQFVMVLSQLAHEASLPGGNQ